MEERTTEEPQEVKDFIHKANQELGLSKHSRLLPDSMRFRQFSHTKQDPYVKRAKNRIKNRKARKARRNSR